MFICSNNSLSKILQPSVFFPFVSHVSGWHELFLTDATTLVKGFVGDRQFNLDSPRTILTNVSWLRVMLCLCKIFLENSVLIFLTGIAEPGAAQGE